MRKSAANLTIEPRIYERAKQYAALHGTNVSQLVGDFLARLPLDEELPPMSAAVRRFVGVAAHGKLKELDREMYREYLVKKYG